MDWLQKCAWYSVIYMAFNKEVHLELQDWYEKEAKPAWGAGDRQFQSTTMDAFVLGRLGRSRHIIVKCLMLTWLRMGHLLDCLSVFFSMDSSRSSSLCTPDDIPWNAELPLNLQKVTSNATLEQLLVNVYAGYRAKNEKVT